MDDVRQEADHATDGEPIVSGYRVCRRLGSGGSATVWLVAKEPSGQKLALKCLAGVPGRQAEEDVQEDVRREILIMSVLDHEHLVKAHDVVRLGEAGEHTLAILMDYAPGGSLGQLVTARGRLSVGETVTVLTPIAQVLGYLHGKGFTHSDVSPGNVLFSGHGKPLLADLGVARMVGDPADTPDVGTAGFRDPSPVDAVRAGLQPWRDVYAVAALGWYCLTGTPPPPAPARAPLSLLVPDVPAELAAALEAGLGEDRRQRPDAAELATAIYRSASAVPVDLSRSAHPTVLPELLTRRPEPPSRSRQRERIRAWGRRVYSSPPAQAFLRRRWAFRIDDQPRSHPRHAVAAAPHRRRATAWGGLLAVPVVAGAWLLLAPHLPLIEPRGPVAAWQAMGGAPAAQDPGPEPGRAADPKRTPVPEAVRSQLQSGNPAEAVKGLAWLRSLALSEGRLELLEEVNAGNSPAAAADLRISNRLQQSGTVLAGFTTSLTGIRRLPESTGTRAVVAVAAETSGYEERTAAGALVATGAPHPGRQLRLVLLRVDGKWLISEILPAD